MKSFKNNIKKTNKLFKWPNNKCKILQIKMLIMMKLMNMKKDFKKRFSKKKDKKSQIKLILFLKYKLELQIKKIPKSNNRKKKQKISYIADNFMFK